MAGFGEHKENTPNTRSRKKTGPKLLEEAVKLHKDGQIVEAEKTEELLYKMKHPYTRALFNASTHRVVMPDVITSGTLLSVDSVIRTYRLPRNGILGSRLNFNALDNASAPVFGIIFPRKSNRRFGGVNAS